MTGAPPPDLWPEFMDRAIALAREAGRRDEVPIGAVIVQNERVIAEGSNRREELTQTTAHAELVALTQYNQQAKSWRLPPGSSVFVTLEPCLMCTGALLWARADFVFFGCADTRNAGLLRVKPLIEAGVYDHRFKQIESGVRETESSRLLSEYFQEKRLS